jgi:NifB/MoaA-like Fe-S oxidoreductase
VEWWQQRALAERRYRWVYGADELYAVAELPLPPADAYDGFEQVENGVGSVRYLLRRIAEAEKLPDLEGKRIGVFTGTAMGRLMPEVLPALESLTGAALELVPLVNDLFGPSVTSAGLLPGQAFARAMQARRDIDLALIPAEALNDGGRFLDDVAFSELAAAAPVTVRPSYDFVDALAEGTPA